MAINPEWERMAQLDPLHAIASDRGRRRGEANAWSAGDFFAKGRAYLDLLTPGLSRIPANAAVLDLGCGAGRFTRALASRFGHVTGVDISPSMVGLAKRLCADVTNAEFVTYGGQRFPAPDASFDAVATIQVLQHVDRKALSPLFGEISRVLRPGGIAVLHIPAPDLRVALQGWLRGVPMRHHLTRLALRLRPGLDVSHRFWAPGQYHTYLEAVIRQRLEHAGLRVDGVFRFRPASSLSTVYVAVKFAAEEILSGVVDRS